MKTNKLERIEEIKHWREMLNCLVIMEVGSIVTKILYDNLKEKLKFFQ